MPSHRDPGFWAGYQRAICIWGFGVQKISNVRAALFKRQITVRAHPIGQLAAAGLASKSEKPPKWAVWAWANVPYLLCPGKNHNTTKFTTMTLNWRFSYVISIFRNYGNLRCPDK